MNIRRIAGFALASLMTLESIACSGSKIQPPLARQSPISTYVAAPTLENQIDWSFLGVKVNLKPEPLQLVLSNYIPLGSEETWASGSGYYGRVMDILGSSLESQLSSRGLKSSDVAFIMTSQNYGVPEDKKIAMNLKKYCEAAEYFLNENLNLNGMEKRDVEWTIFSLGEAYNQNYTGKGFIGKLYYVVNKVKVIKIQDNEPVFILADLGSREGGLGLIDFEKDEYYVFVGSGPSAIVSQFSEILPLYTSKKTAEYSRDVGAEFADQANEALTEAIAISLSQGLSKQLSIPHANALIEDHYLALIAQPLYKYLPQARTWIQQNGVQKAFDLYMKSPAEFMTAIGASNGK